MNAHVLANIIADKVTEEFSVVEFSQFCDERGDIDFVDVSEVAAVIEKVLIECYGESLNETT